MDDALLFAALLFTGLTAGLFFGWAVSVNPGLRRVADDTYIETMQRINVAIVNPIFILFFIGTPLVVIAAATANESATATSLWISAAIYVVGVLGVTIGGNIPLNNALDEFDLPGADAGAAVQRRHSYETPWVRWHNVRTAANIAAFVFAVIGALA